MQGSINDHQQGIVFNIQKFSVHDGPGIRTIVFLKGCPLSCQWCSNPESQSTTPAVMFYEKNCVSCGRCVNACPKQAIDPALKGIINRERCNDCGLCVEACHYKALVMSGSAMTVREVVTELKKDTIHYRRSGGGITISGGEPFLQSEFLLELLRACKNQGWHTAIETTGLATEKQLEDIIPYIDLVLLDIKHIVPERHEDQTGVSSLPLLKNAIKIGELAREVAVRIPVIPDFNGDEDSISQIARFIRHIKSVSRVHLLPYHRLGDSKYDALGKKNPMELGHKAPSPEELAHYQSIIEAQGFQCVIGG